MKKLFSASLFIVVLVLSSCKNHPGVEPDAKVEISDSLAQFIKIDTAKETNVTNQLQLVGQVSFNEDQVIRVYPAASGVAQNIKVSLGDYVQKGQTLCDLRSSDIAGAQGDISAAISDSAAAIKNYEATQDLFNNGLASEPDLINAKANYQKAQAQLKKLRTQLSINNGEGSADAAVIRTPNSGYILEKKINNGMLVRADNSDNLFTIGNLDDVWVLADVYETDIDKVKTGMEAEVTTLSYPDKIFHGKIEKIANTLDPVSKVMKIRIRLNNAEHLLKPEMFTKVTLEWSEGIKKMMVPSSSIIMENSKNYVVLYRNRKDVETREVKIDKEVGGKTFLETGVAQGDMVISKSQLIIYEALKD